jgi:leucyl aminopeptidase
MKVNIDKKLSLKPADCIVVPLTEEAVKNVKRLLSKGEKYDKKGFTKLSGIVQDLLKSNEFKGKKDQVVFGAASKASKMPRVMLFGLGKEEKLDLEKTRKAFGTITRALNKAGVKHGQVSALAWKNVDDGKAIIQAMTVAIMLSLYQFTKYKKGDPRPLEKMTLVVSEMSPKVAKTAADRGMVIGESVKYIRSLVNDGGDNLNPTEMEKEVRATAKLAGLKLTVFDHKKLKKLGCNLLLAVSAGSDHPGRMFFLEHRGDPKSKELTALVGKGVTFDTGGVNVKTGRHMEEMQMDMGGAGAVLGTMRTIAQLKLKKNVIGVIPCVENTIDSRSYKPSSVYKGYNGKTVEVLNTDAEGRLILADALAYTAKNYKPTQMIDLATLTGSVVVTLGEHVAGMVGNDQPLMDRLQEAGLKTYERVWQLPFYDEYKEEMKSRIADLRNINDQHSGAITASCFLANFVGKTKWAHFDIAGTAYVHNPLSYQSKGGTGFGIRLLTEFLSS